MFAFRKGSMPSCSSWEQVYKVPIDRYQVTCGCEVLLGTTLAFICCVKVSSKGRIFFSTQHISLIQRPHSLLWVCASRGLVCKAKIFFARQFGFTPTLRWAIDALKFCIIKHRHSDLGLERFQRTVTDLPLW